MRADDSQSSKLGPDSGQFSPFAKKVLTAVGIVGAAIILWGFLENVVAVFLAVFAAILLAVILHGSAQRLSAHTPLSRGWALAAVMVAILGVAGGGGALLAPQVTAQVAEMRESLPRSIETVRSFLEENRVTARLLERAPAPSELVAGDAGLFSRISSAFTAFVGLLATILFTLVVAVYLAVNPELYLRSVVRLLPVDRRTRAREVLSAVGDALWQWLMGTLVAMAIIGVLTWLGLMLIGLPLALALGVIAGLFEFVPLLGPWAAAVPALLIGLMEGPKTLLYVGLVYLVVQQIEGNLVTPLVMKRAVSLPPAYTLIATVVAGVLFGIPGVLLATPLMVVGMVVFRMVYREDILGESPDSE